MSSFDYYPRLYTCFLFPYGSLLYKSWSRVQSDEAAPLHGRYPINHRRIVNCAAWTAAARLVYFLTGLRWTPIPRRLLPLLASNSYYSVFTAYTLVIYCWAESCHRAHPQTVAHPSWMAPFMVGVNAVLYVVCFGLFLLMVILDGDERQMPVAATGTTFMSTYYTVTAGACVSYGLWLRRLWGRYSLLTWEVRHQLGALTRITTAFTCCFLLQALMTYISFFQAELFYAYFWVFQSLFLGAELLPLHMLVGMLGWPPAEVGGGGGGGAGGAGGGAPAPPAPQAKAVVEQPGGDVAVAY